MSDSCGSYLAFHNAYESDSLLVQNGILLYNTQKDKNSAVLRKLILCF
jgi:hypothetical protein